MYCDMYLYRVSLCAENVWSPYYLKKVKPIYLVSRNKEYAKEYATNHMKRGLAIKSISLIARQLAPVVFTGEI